MALSQLQCLDDHHVNPRTTESKPEFQYCEDQRLGLETLLARGREAFARFLEERGLRGFLSDLEQDTLTAEREPFDPDSDLYPEGADGDEPPLSQDYWPELSDRSAPRMDLGWPDSESYRGVTRTTVYSQPPQEGQAHVKEVVRKMIAQAQKVIAVVMDVFTDVDIFRDLLDISFKKKVSVYILVERKTLPHFLSMCHRADMHAGHLKHLRVRCTGGREFYTRSCTRVCGRLGHRFMFIDGDKAVSGSYSFTWMSSRLDRNLVTVVTGQAVDTFDRLFQCLYMTSSHVDLRHAATKPEPAPEPIPQRAPAPAPSADIARKLHNPKYSLVIGTSSPSAVPSTGPNAADQAQNRTNSQKSEPKKGRRKRGGEVITEAPPLHPGLENLEKAHLVEYLPTWPEPDPSSDVIGFINIVDTSRPAQVHLQRSERFGVSQAIKFSSPIGEPRTKHAEVSAQKQPSQRESRQDTTAGEADGVGSTPGPDSATDRGHPAAASPSTASLSKSAPTDCSRQPTVPTETTPNRSTDDNANQGLSGDAEEQPSETAEPPPDKTGPGSPLTTPSPVVTPPTPKPRTVRLCVKEGTTNGGLEKQSAVTELKWKPGAEEPSNSTGHESSPEPDAGHVARPEARREAPEEGSAPGLMADGTARHNGVKDSRERSGQQPKTNSDHPNIPEGIPREADQKTSEALGSATEQVANVNPADEAQTGGRSEAQNVAQLRVYHAKSSEPQVISYGGQAVTQLGSAHAVDPNRAARTSPSAEHRRPTLTAAPPSWDQDAQRKAALPTRTSENKQADEQTRRPLAASQAPEPERSPYTFRRISTPDGSRTPTPVSRTATPDSPLKPGCRTPTPVSDGYVSSKEDSTLSTTSDEYYECSESLFNEWFFDRNAYRSRGPRDDAADATSPGLEKQENTIDSEKKVDVARRKRDPEAASENDGKASPRVTRRPPQVPPRQGLPNSSPDNGPADGEAKTHVATGGLNSRKLSPGAEWQVLSPSSAEPPRMAEELEEMEGTQEAQGQRSSLRPPPQPRPPQPASSPRLLTPRARGGQPQNHPVEMMLLKNSARAPPARPPPPRVEASHADLQNQNKPASPERRSSPASTGLLRHTARAQNQSRSESEEPKHEEGRAPFSITLGKLHKITSLKDKKGKKGSGSPAEGRKSSS